MTKSLHFAGVAAILAVGLFATAPLALADTMFNVQYFTAPTGSSDFYNGVNVPIGVSTNYVTSTLGANGLPVFNPSFTAASGTVLAPNSIYLGSGNQLLYWSPTNPKGGHISADGTGTLALSGTAINMFAPLPNGNGSTDTSVEETAILTGFFTVPNGDTDTVTFDVGADDTAFVYVDGNLVESLGGIHGDTSVPSVTATYGAGQHEIQIFYADHDVTQAALSFTDNDNLTIVPTSVPEPSSFILLGSGLLAAAGVVRRRLAV